MARVFGVRSEDRGGVGGGGGWGGERKSKQYSFTELQGRRNTVLQYYLLFTIQIPKNPEIYFRYYKILFKIALNSLFNDRGVYFLIILRRRIGRVENPTRALSRIIP